MTWYQLALLGNPAPALITEITDKLTDAVGELGLILGTDVSLHIGAAPFTPNQKLAAATLYFGAEGKPEHADLDKLLRNGIPVIPVATDEKRFTKEIPAKLHPINGVFLNKCDVNGLVSILLEGAGLLPRQRRVFISYKREESRDIALQLFEALSARLFDVFLDTHGIAKGEHFQNQLWHKLCDCDVVLMLDTPNYFESRWTRAEFGRALAKSVAILRVGWPNHALDRRAQLARNLPLTDDDFAKPDVSLTPDAIQRICAELESARTTSIAVRYRNLVSSVELGIEQIGGKLQGVGQRRRISLRLPDGKHAIAFPALGVPNSSTMQEALHDDYDGRVAIVFDHLGVHPNWLTHMDWLSEHVKSVQWIRGTEAAWAFADWEG